MSNVVPHLHDRKRLPRRGRPATVLGDSKDDLESRLPGSSNATSALGSEGALSLLEFVTFTGPSHKTLQGTSTRIRTQVMRNHVRKKNQATITGIDEAVPNPNPEQPSKYKGRFKLDSWTHSTKTKAVNARRLLEQNKNFGKASIPNIEQSNIWQVRLGFDCLLDSQHLDPFNSLSIILGPQSEGLLLHYHNSYSMNSVSINPEADFFSQARTDAAVFHSVLYLVSLHLDLKLGRLDSPESLYHGSEAITIINRRIREGVFNDMTIAAVGMLATKENLNGKYDLSKIHMHGLESMVKARGGIGNIRGVFQRVVTWSDFCYANVWNCQPRFPRLNLHPHLNAEEESNLLPPENLFGSTSPIIPIFHSLRALASSLSPANLADVDRLCASNTIYETEFSLLALNKRNANDLEPSSCIYSFEAIPLKTAAHLFLYLVVREIPSTSQLLFRLAERLQEALDIQLGGWWDSKNERRLWLLWMLFIGAATFSGRYERWWFVKEIDSVCQGLAIDSQDKLQNALTKVLWQDAWCSGHCASLWDDLTIFSGEEISLGQDN